MSKRGLSPLLFCAFSSICHIDLLSQVWYNKRLALPMLGTSAGISFFQELREFLIKSLHLWASRRFPLIDRLINGVGSRISLKPPIWQLFAQSSGTSTLSPFSRNPLYTTKIFNPATLFPSIKISNPHLPPPISLSFSLTFIAAFFSSLWFLFVLSIHSSIAFYSSTFLLPRILHHPTTFLSL